MIDKLGQELNEGDYILYARTMGKSADLGIGRILEFEETHHPEEYGQWCWIPRPVPWTKVTKDYARAWMLEHCDKDMQLRQTHSGYQYYDEDKRWRIASTSHKVRVNSIQGIHFADLSGKSQYGRDRPVETSAEIRKVTLQFPSRMVKINDLVPEVVKNLLGDTNEN